MISGLTAGFIATLLTNPLDVIRMRLQYSKYHDLEKFKSIREGCASIY